MDKYPNLEDKFLKKTESNWTLENIKEGFEYFKELHGRYPTGPEMDSFQYLPSHKTIERRFSGLVALRGILNIEGAQDFTKGSARSEMARRTFINAQKFEEEFLSYLTSKIPQVRVHEHKIIRPGHTATDFFVFTNDTEGVGIDIFYAKDIHSVCGVIRIKSLKAINVICPMYYVLVGNEDITQEMIDDHLDRKKQPLASNIRVMTENYFKANMRKILVLEPLKESQ